jgi:hypothetical protein
MATADGRLMKIGHGFFSASLIAHCAWRDIKPTFENDTNIVTPPPRHSALSNRAKVVERDVEVRRKAP